MSVAERYAAIAGRCSAIEIDEIWAALLFGRRAQLSAKLDPIAFDLDALRDEVGAASADRSRKAVASCTVLSDTVQSKAVA